MMRELQTKRLSVNRDVIAPDGSDVRVLLQLAGGSMAHFELAPGETSVAVAHREVEEIWFILSGRGEMWRKNETGEVVVPLEANVCITIPKQTLFQFRSFGYVPLNMIGVTMPPWSDKTASGESQIVEVEGIWQPTLQAGSS